MVVKFLWKMPLSEIQGNRRLEQAGGVWGSYLKSVKSPSHRVRIHTRVREFGGQSSERERERKREQSGQIEEGGKG